jgi:chromosome partitioning protein
MAEVLFEAEVRSALSMKHAGETFNSFKDKGNLKLDELRRSIVSPKDLKEPRTYGVNEVANLVGRSIPWLREHDTDTPKGTNGRKIYTLERIQQLRIDIGSNFVRPEATQAIVKAITNFKGGVGKTTTTVHEAHFMASMKGLKVLVIDLDPQASSTFSLGPFIPDLELEASDTILPVMLEDFKLLPRAIRRTYIPNIDLIPANLEIQDLDFSLPNSTVNNSEKMGSPLRRLERIIKVLKPKYDLILIDCPPNMGSLTTNALIAADALMIPVPPASYDLASFVMFSKSLGNIFTQIGKELDYVRLLITKHPGTATARKVEADIRNLYGEYVISTAVVQTTEVEKACDQFTSVYDLNKPLSSRAAYNRAITNFNTVY